MMSPIEKRLPNLKKRHYVRNARTRNFWFDFAARKLATYSAKYGDNFRLVIHGVSASYIIPFSKVRDLFGKEKVDDKGRWSGAIIEGHIMRMSHDNGEHNVREYMLSHSAPDAEFGRWLDDAGAGTNGPSAAERAPAPDGPRADATSLDDASRSFDCPHRRR